MLREDRLLSRKGKENWVHYHWIGSTCLFCWKIVNFDTMKFVSLPLAQQFFLVMSVDRYYPHNEIIFTTTELVLTCAADISL